MKVTTPPGEYVGRIQQQCTWVVPFYLVRDANEQALFVIEGPAVLKRSALLLSEFKVSYRTDMRLQKDTICYLESGLATVLEYEKITFVVLYRSTRP